MALIRATRGRGIIISSEAKRALAIRAPMDVVNLACVWGLSQGRGKEAVCEEARKVVALARLKRTSWRGIVDVIDGGEKPPADARSHGSKKPDMRTSSTTDINGDKLKRKAPLDSTMEAEKPLSKREMKRRAKKARLDAHGADNTNDAPS